MINLLFGTRPEAIKVGPVAAELRALGVPFSITCTSQHAELLQGTPAESDLSGAVSLTVARHDNLDLYAQNLTVACKNAWTVQRPTVVVVQGDTVSALAGARAADQLGIPIAHVEAGVRSHDKEPYPEEMYRVIIDSYAERLYCSTLHCFDNLQTLVHGQEAFVTGNTVVSALFRYTTARPVAAPEPTILVTLHRRELYNDTKRFRAIKDKIAEEARKHRDITFVWPVHPATQTAAYSGFQRPHNVCLVDPMPYGECAAMLASSLGVLTDSGGLQEEAATLGVPCAVIREVSDRPESIEAGVAKLYGAKPESITKAVADLTGGVIPRKATNVYGHADAAALVATDLKTWSEGL